MTKGINLRTDIRSATAGEILRIAPARDCFISLKTLILYAGTAGDQFTLYARDGTHGWTPVIADIKVPADEVKVVDFAGKEIRYLNYNGTNYSVPAGDNTTVNFKVGVSGTGGWSATLLWKEEP